MQSNSFNPISAGAQTSIKAFYYDFCEFMVENYSATPDQLMLDWNCVGATARYHGQNRAFEFRLWEHSDGHLGIPDMTLIIIRISFRGTQDVIRAEMKAFIHWLKQTAKAHGFLHLADEDCQPLPTGQVPGCRIACIRL